ncbi:MAG: hypothetical protein WC595_04560 [Candidatus Nanoarchaeia archaeon]
MKSFIGIGIRHKIDFYDPILKILDEHKPEAVTIEHALDPNYLIGRTEEKELRKSLEEGIPHELRWEERGWALRSGNLLWYGTRHDYPCKWKREFDGAIGYALKASIPIYFVEWSTDLPKSFLEFKNGQVKSIPTKDLTDFTGCSFLAWEDITFRNQFSAEAINNLLKVYESVAHVGGRGHFDSRIREGTFEVKQGYELQHLIKAENKVVYDLVSGEVRKD